MKTVKINESTENFDAMPNAAMVPARTVAAVIGMSEATVWRMAKAGKLTAKKVGERATRFNVGEVRKLIAA
jgi:predicted DNA-binding transcriptional regulator AlpA